MITSVSIPIRQAAANPIPATGFSLWLGFGL
jgi:hypothetical protein